jgi:tellurite resistance-related uncharacterized protein
MSWPSTLVSWDRTKEFTQDTVPPALLEEHTTPAGMWGLLRVLEGSLKFIDMETDEESVLSPKSPGFIEPGQRHRVVCEGDVRFYIEFYKDTATP